MNQGFAVVDFETTGLSPAKGDRAIEIGLVHVAPDGTLEDEHETLIHVDRSVGASWVHHITARDLLHAPDFEGIAHELRDLLAGRVFVAHNVSFDSRFLLAEYSRMGASIPVHQSTMLCTMKLSRSLIGRGKLSDCCDYFGIANEDAHSALGDAHATALLLGVYGQINVYGVTTKSERHKRSYWTRTADGNGIGGRKAPVPYGS